MDISSMLEVQVNEMKTEEMNLKENATSRAGQSSNNPVIRGGTPPGGITEEEYKLYIVILNNDIASVRFHRLHCTACDIHIGSAPSNAHNMLAHPVLRTLLCERCHEFYGDGRFEQGDDATDMFCRWCANGGNLYCCSYCSNTFCYKCIKINFSPSIRQKIEADEKWKCFVCDPSELTPARAVYWGLQQHIQTLLGILNNMKTLSSEEFDEKMNLDDSLCCPRRRRSRHKRKLQFNSEEEDETYRPEDSYVSVYRETQVVKRKVRKTTTTTTTTTTTKPSYQQYIENQDNTQRDQNARGSFYPSIGLIPIRPRPFSSLEQSTSQAVHKKPDVTQPSESTVIPPTTVTHSDKPSRFDLPLVRSLYPTLVNHTAVPSIVYPQSSMSNSMPSKILLPPLSSSSSQIQKISRQQSSQPLQPPNTMVSIPNAADSRPRFLVARPQESNVTLTPNIIELDSDSDDELKIIEQPNNSAINCEMNATNVSSDKVVVPVALVSTGIDDKEDVNEEQPLREMSSTLEKRPVFFSEMMSPYSQKLDKLSNDIKKKPSSFFALSDDEVLKDMKLGVHRKIKKFHQNIRDIAFQLICINDMVVREYKNWQSYRKIEKIASPSSAKQTTLMSQDNIPLDMTCVNDSDSDAEADTEPEDRIVEPFDLVKASNIVKDLLFLNKKKDMVHRGVGDRELLCEDKAIQAYDIISKDYEKCISYSLLTKADYDPKTKDNVSESVAAPDENFGKYEEQFIFYLQHIENHGIEMEDTKGLVDSDEVSLVEMSVEKMSLTEPKEANSPPTSPCVPESLQHIESSVVSTELPENFNQKKNSNTSSVINDEICSSENTTEKDEEIAQIVNDLSLDDKIPIIRSDEKIQETKLQKTHNGATDGEVMLLMSKNNDVNLSENVNNAVNTEAINRNEEDCTIIDD